MSNTRTKPTFDSGSMEERIQSRQDDRSNLSDSELKPGDTPTFYGALLFFDGFYQHYFKDMFNFLAQNDPMLGKGTFGHLARFIPERM